jgi:hypothetical protein
MNIQELLAQLEKFSDAELKKLIHVANVVLDAREDARKEEQYLEQCVAEMVCQRCGQELDSEDGLSGQCPSSVGIMGSGCHQLV